MSAPSGSVFFSLEVSAEIDALVYNRSQEMRLRRLPCVMLFFRLPSLQTWRCPPLKRQVYVVGILSIPTEVWPLCARVACVRRSSA